MQALLKEILDPRRLPWVYIAIVLAGAVLVAWPELRPALLYDREAILQGEFWRIWTGHAVHFGWPHFLADGALFVIIGWTLERDHPWFGRIALVLMPVVVSAALFWFDPAMNIYGGLSGLNVGLLVFLACAGWRGHWLDWFWPAILVIHVVELYLEASRQGTGGGAIRFDDPSIRVATIAHIGGAAYGLVVWLGLIIVGRRRTRTVA